MDINEIRSGFDALGTKYGAADGVSIDKELIEGITCYWFYTGKAKSLTRVAIYLHGGCYALGSINSHRAMVSRFVKAAGVTFLFVEYGLAPEHTYPVAINETLKVYDHLVEKVDVESVSFIGDSAGAGLLVSVISILNSRKANRLDQVVMLSPWVDLRNSNDSVKTNKDIDPILNKEGLDSFTSMYAGKNSIAEINPIDEPLDFFPPTLILVGTNEILLDDAKKMREKILKVQHKVQLSIYEGQVHGWPLLDIDSEASENAIIEIKDFLSLDN